jgi:hypothetical protein
VDSFVRSATNRPASEARRQKARGIHEIVFSCVPDGKP